ncbi:MAG: hypothetical protein MJ237_05185 [bacterium]|nr:hypothetical protein [bacterium]
MGNNLYKPLKKKKKFTVDTKKMGVNIDKNEYYEIILSNSNHPENSTKSFY